MIGKRIQEIRKNRQLSLSELAERAGVAKSYLSSIERNLQSNPSIQFLEKISKELHVSMNYLLHGESKQDTSSLDDDWLDLVKEAQESGISKEQFREYLEFNKWRTARKE
ncbi:helix-turn-helix domain-containing protein [Halobacillus sp. Marseille-Q1614]|uniref:helix-turn-helix domain-containing protein n=1 Tax=Halobacillus sp. Marseille-Q1614 TaxID=2709134 RepID=UPI00156F364F|nr:helix-turn-helix domain-containing protein [Halobacillus sp. Marseille-Q1614]